MTPEVNTIVAVRMSDRDGDVRHVDVAEFVRYEDSGKGHALKRWIPSFVACAIVAEGEDEPASLDGFRKSMIREAMAKAGCERVARNKHNRYFLPKLLQLLAEGKGT
jgi:hypothetical protein